MNRKGKIPLKQLIKNIVFCLIILCLFLAILEMGARITKTIRNDLRSRELQSWFVYSPVLGWERRPNFKGIAAREYREFDSQGYMIRKGRSFSQNRSKILLLGDSCTYGLQVEIDSTYGAFLEDKLGSVDVVNLAVPGYTSYQGLQVLERVISLNPSLIIASFSFNDRRYVLNKADMDSPSHFQFIWRWSWVNYLNNYSYVYKMLSTDRIGRIDLRTTPVRVPLEEYTSNLEKMVEIAQNHKIPLIFLILEDNPNITLHIRRGLEWKEKGLLLEAIKAFKQAFTLYQQVTDLPRLLLVQAYEELGETERANQMARINPLIRLHGGTTLRTDTEYAQAMVNFTGRSYTYVYDARPVLEEDPSVFFDVVHFNEDGHRRIAQDLYEFIVTHNLLPDNKI